MSNTVSLIVVSLILAAWAVFVSARSRQWLEAVGYVVVWLAVAAALVLTNRDGAEPARRILVGIAFLVALPLLWVNLKRRRSDLRR